MRNLLLITFAALLIFSSFDTSKKNKVKLPEEFAWIPSGTFNLTDSTTRISLPSFYLSKFEVTNLQYRTFFTEVSANLTAEELEKIKCDDAGWNSVSGFGEPLVKYYYSHPAYNNYPVVNISYEGATRYCQWLQQKLQKDHPGLDIEVRLPSKEEWIWAAMGGRSQAMFPWGNFYLRNKKGEPLCNYKRVNDFAIYRNRTTGKPEVSEAVMASSQIGVYTTTVKSYYPNDFGLYNMCGNVAEMITEKGVGVGGSWNDYGGDVHIRAAANYERSTPTIGFRPLIIVKETTRVSK